MTMRWPSLLFAALKNERVYRTQYPTREHARRDVVRYIEFWYNSKRRHSGLQYRTPQASPTMSIWNSSPQRELTTNTLSGKLGADQIIRSAVPRAVPRGRRRVQVGVRRRARDRGIARPLALPAMGSPGRRALMPGLPGSIGDSFRDWPSASDDDRP